LTDIVRAAWSAVIQPEDAISYWQPLPSSGYVTVSLSPANTPYDGFSAGTQVLPPGRHVREHGHQQNHELVFIYEGEGRCEIEGVSQPLRPGTTVLFGRYSRHLIENTGSTDMKLHWVFFPPGLEHWFAAIGRRRLPGEPMPEPFDRPANVTAIQEQMRFVPPRSQDPQR
jgi:mannose-6-phosphate isomerase-like protein (cupin superfamily)